MLVTPNPFTGMFVGLLVFVALWVIDRVPEKGPVAVGRNRTVISVDAPGARLNAPNPLVTVKGGARSFTSPVRVPAEPG
jgi:hypothetical protein